MSVQGTSAVESDRQQWRTAVAGVLAKSSRRDVADLPAEPERLLDSQTYEGFADPAAATPAWTRFRSPPCRGSGRTCAAATPCVT